MTCPTYPELGCNHTGVSRSHTDLATMFLCNACCLACSKTHALFTWVGLAAALVLCAVTSCMYCLCACRCICECVCSVVCAGHTSNLPCYRHGLQAGVGCMHPLNWMQIACRGHAGKQQLHKCCNAACDVTQGESPRLPTLPIS